MLASFRDVDQSIYSNDGRVLLYTKGTDMAAIRLWPNQLSLVTSTLRCKDVNFDCSEKGIEVQCMDSSHVALVGLLLRECAFSELLGRKKLQNFSISICI